VEAIVDGNVDGSELFHGIVADSEELKHDVHLLNSDVAVVVEVKETDGDNDDDGEDEESDVIKSGVLVEQMVIVVLLNEEVVVLFHDQVLVMNDFGLLDPPEQLVIHLGPLVDQFQFCLVAMNHFAVQFSLHQKCYYEPVNPNKSINVTFSEQ
jgi:hypothetical protein